MFYLVKLFRNTHIFIFNLIFRDCVILLFLSASHCTYVSLLCKIVGRNIFLKNLYLNVCKLNVFRIVENNINDVSLLKPTEWCTKKFNDQSWLNICYLMIMIP